MTRWHQAYWAWRAAFVWKNHPEVRMVAGKWTPVAKGMPDYTGVLSGGQAVGFDAKSTRNRKFALSMIPAHQAQALDQIRELGGLAFLALRFELENTNLVVPWTAELSSDYRQGGRAVTTSGPWPRMDADGWLNWSEKCWRT